MTEPDCVNAGFSELASLRNCTILVADAGQLD